MSDPILLWNKVALEANRISHTNGQGEQAGPPLSARVLAIVHLAIYDAYAVKEPDGLPRYIAKPDCPIGASPEAAVAVAAHATLCDMFPSQRRGFDFALSTVGDVCHEAELREMRGKGIKADLMEGGTPRSVNETLIGLYWGITAQLGLERRPGSTTRLFARSPSREELGSSKRPPVRIRQRDDGRCGDPGVGSEVLSRILATRGRNLGARQIDRPRGMRSPRESG